jgi:uncharacterized membrane protein (UPF0127 family)
MFSSGGCSKKEPPSPPKATIAGTTWTLEIAATPTERYQGLSGRTSIPSDRGMLFVFPRVQAVEFCMRDCEVPIDIAFIDRDGRVVKAETMAVEPDRLGTKLYDSEKPILYVLEVAGGSLSSAGVKKGDLVSFSSGIPAGT